ncbi:YdeI/OmpD-associated family protein [Jatrophihabitans endophyticus]|uniref:YdeI/OmpD-associated family protein n=1 Tax=Jatrophihabitans endophyticus TaxID=1206085 RepID=UPI0019FBD8D1|nr:YdeI/OmpD-associated family protein [Jatrophihabitans endophyticus]MBE7187631.1 DUF1905 domain-containing protein [Jatrophihabitans endophyticus]
MTRQTAASLEFEAELETIDATALLRLPEAASRALPSRGQVAVRGSVDGHEFETVLEPDGRRGHWLRVDAELAKAAGVQPGDTVRVAVETVADWPEPQVPADLQKALKTAPADIREVWDDITPMARWEWVRWVDATANPATRQRRVEVTISKIEHGKRRPCCFDLSACTDPSVARNAKLRDPD